MSSEQSSKCLFCNEEIPVDENNEIEAIKTKLFGYRTKVPDKSSEDFEKQVSIFFMLRKVLCLPTDILEQLLVAYGSPTSWQIKLCRPCARLCAEVECVWNKVKTMVKEFEKIVYEIKDKFVNSINPEEGEALVEYSDDLEAYKSVIIKQITDKKTPILDCVRATFFLNLHQQSGEKEDADNDVFKSELERIGQKPKTRSVHVQQKLKWNEMGIPFVNINEFQNKMTDLLETFSSSTKSIITDWKENVEISKPNRAAPVEIVNLEEEPSESIKNRKIRSNKKMDTKKCSSSASSAPQLSVNESSLQLILTNNALSRQDSNSTESTPEVLGILKRDINFDEASTVEMNANDDDDPLMKPDKDDDDPDYVPDDDDFAEVDPLNISSPQTSSKNTHKVSTEEDMEMNPEHYPSRLKSLKCKAIHTGDKIFECSKCHFDFNDRHGCLTHIMKDHYNQSSPYHCHICSLKCVQFFKMKEHIIRMHGSVRTAYDDDFDPDKDYIPFKHPLHEDINEEEERIDMDQLKNKMLLIHDCPMCSEKFEYKSKLNHHAMVVHGLNLKGKIIGNVRQTVNRKDELLCQLCVEDGNRFQALTKDHLEVHNRVRHSITTIATTTGKVAKKRTGISQKMPKATKKPRSGGGTMKCPDCSKVLSTSGEMAEHMKKPENQCPDCNKHFLFDMDLKKHMQLDHLKPFQCPYCPKTFTAQTIYEKHIDNHQRLDVHECEVCHVKLTGFTNFTAHMQTHSAVLQQQMRQDPEIFGI